MRAFTGWRVCLLALLLSAACARAPVRPPPPEVPEPPDLDPGTLIDRFGDPVALEDFRQACAGRRYILIGENHGQSCDHEVQAALLSALADCRPAVGLEMVDIDSQPALDRFAAGDLDLDELPHALDWQRTWGVPFELYLPVFEAARSHGLPLVALNLPRELVRRFGEVGLDGLSESERALLPPEIVAPPEEQKTWLRAQFDGHPLPPGEDLTEQELLRRFLRVQSLWDSQMAHRAVNASRALERPVVILAGAGHVVHGWGISHRLEAFDPQGRRLLIVPWRGTSELDPEAAEYFFYCPLEPKEARPPAGPQ